MIEVLQVQADAGLIVRYAEHLRRLSPTSSLGVSDAWSSPMIAHDYQAVREMLQAAAAARSGATSERLEWQAWANINPPGTAVGPHTHHTARDGRRPRFCLIYFPGDHPAALVFPDLDVRIQPQAGLAVAFPPDAAHCVERNATDRPRLSIAANAFPRIGETQHGQNRSEGRGS